MDERRRNEDHDWRRTRDDRSRRFGDEARAEGDWRDPEERSFGRAAMRGGGEGREPWRDRDRGRDGLRVGRIMTHGAEVLEPDMTLRDAARRMRADNLGAYPVGERERLIGMVTDRDIVMRGVANDRLPSRATVREVMSEQVFFCFEDDDVEDAAALMARHQVRRMPVLDRDRRLVGMLALADLGRSGVEAAREALSGVCEPTDAPRR
jgi:CBS domain-containing protein